MIKIYHVVMENLNVTDGKKWGYDTTLATFSTQKEAERFLDCMMQRDVHHHETYPGEVGEISRYTKSVVTGMRSYSFELLKTKLIRIMSVKEERIFEHCEEIATWKYDSIFLEEREESKNGK